jgi:hypothetical protein
LAIVAAIGIASAAFEAGLDGLEYQKEHIVELKSGKVEPPISPTSSARLCKGPIRYCKTTRLKSASRAIYHCSISIWY